MASRPIETLPKDKDGLFVEPDKLTPDVAAMVDHNRARFVHHFNYADEYCGHQSSYDEQGSYNCGRCNMAEGVGCLLLKIGKIDRDAGSCEDWEKIRPGDAELRLKRKSPDAASYGVAANGVGFGCARCPYATQAKNTDGEGRSLWCGEGGFHVTPLACCGANGADNFKAYWR